MSKLLSHTQGDHARLRLKRKGVIFCKTGLTKRPILYYIGGVQELLGSLGCVLLFEASPVSNTGFPPEEHWINIYVLPGGG
jgi:hypothetical protein